MNFLNFTFALMAEKTVLEPLGLINDDDSSVLGRRIEWMNSGGILVAIIMFAIINVFVILALIFGPPYYVSQKMVYNQTQNDYFSRRFSFDFHGLNYFNDFLTLDVYFNRSLNPTFQNYNLTVLFYGSMMIGSRMYEKLKSQTLEFPVSFENGSMISDKYRIFASGVVKFDTFHSLITLNQYQGLLMPGVFEWSFADPSHSLVQVFIRLLFFVLSLTTLIKLILSDFSVKKSHVTMKMMFILDILLVLASDPFYILSYFSASPLFKLIDSIMCMFLLVTAAYVALSSLLMSNVTHEDVSRFWLSIRYLPFFLAFCLFAFSSIYSISKVNKDPLHKTDDTLKFISYAKIGFALLYLASLVYASFTFHSDILYEKPVYSFLALILFGSVITSEFYNALDPYLGTDAAIQTFAFSSIATYVLFYNYFNWPSDSTIAPDQEVQDMGEQ